jgi:hypothetical protein
MKAALGSAWQEGRLIQGIWKAMGLPAHLLITRCLTYDGVPELVWEVRALDLQDKKGRVATRRGSKALDNNYLMKPTQ